MTKTNLKGKKFKSAIVRNKLREGILASLGSSDIQWLSKKAMPSPSRDAREKSINFGKGLDRIYGTKPLGDQENPFALLQKIKPSASENKKLSWFKSAVVKAGSPKEMHKVVDQGVP